MQASDRGLDFSQPAKPGDALDLLASDSTIATVYRNAFAAINDDFKLNVKAAPKSRKRPHTPATAPPGSAPALPLLIVLLCALIGIILTREIAPRLGRLKDRP